MFPRAEWPPRSFQEAVIIVPATNGRSGFFQGQRRDHFPTQNQAAKIPSNCPRKTS